MDVYTKQVFSANSEITGSYEVVEARRELLEEMAALTSERMANSRTVPFGHIPGQISPVYMKHFVGNVYNDVSSFEKCQEFPLWKWSDKWRCRFHNMDKETLLMLDASSRKITVKKSKVSHSDVGLVCSAARIFGKGVVVGYYSSSVVYSNWTAECQTMITKSVVRVNAKTLGKLANELSERIMDKNGAERNM